MFAFATGVTEQAERDIEVPAVRVRLRAAESFAAVLGGDP